MKRICLFLCYLFIVVAGFAQSGIIETTDTTGCDQFQWRGQYYYQSGNYADTIWTGDTLAVIDTIYRLNLTINHSSDTIQTEIQCDSFAWYGIAYTTSTTTPTHTLQNVAGCDSVVTLHLTINYSNSGVQVETHCDSFFWHDSVYTATTSNPTYIEHNAAGCDSVVTLHLIIKHRGEYVDNQEQCDSYRWINGIEYTSSISTPYVVLSTKNSVGCDSIIRLNLTMHHTSLSTYFDTACDSYTWINGQTYLSSTDIPQLVLRNQYGCDSIVTLNLIVNYSTTGVQRDTACDSYEWHGTTYTSSTATPTFTEQNISGCDSVVTLNLIIKNSSTSDEMITACDSSTWHGVTYYTSTDEPAYIDTNAVGCDSVITLHLTIRYSTYGVDVQRHCHSYSWIDGVDYDASTTTPVDTIQNGYGCDSIVTLNLTIQQDFIVQKWSDVLIVNKKQIDNSLTGNSCRWYMTMESEDVFLGTGLYHRAAESGDYIVSIGDSIWSCPHRVTVNQQKTIAAFPNPVINRTTVSGGNWRIGDRVVVTNMYGIIVVEESVKNQSSVEIDMTSLPKGIYLIQVANDLVKVIKQ